MKPPVARKQAVGHLCVRQLVFWLQVVPSLNYFKVHACSTSILLLLHSAFMLSVVKMLLKGEVGDRALNSHENYIVDHAKSCKNHGIVFFNFCGNPALMRENLSLGVCKQQRCRQACTSALSQTDQHLFCLPFGKYTETIKLCPLDVYVGQFQMYERISFKFSHYQL